MGTVAATLGLVQRYPYHTITASLFILVVKALFFRKRASSLPLPPGPKGYPLVGNIFDIPTDKPWLVYNEWAKIYGDMIYFKVLGQPFLVLHTLERTYDIFEKRSSNYSDRARMPMILELMNWDYNIAMLPYGTWWRRHRRAFHEHFHPGVVAKYQPVQSREARAFLYRLLVSPENFRHHIRHAFAATIMSVAYGITVRESNDPYILNAEEALEGLSEAGVPGRFLVDLIPVLKYVPEWFPGANFKRKAARWRKVTADVAQKPFCHVKEQMAKGTAVPSLAATLIESLPDASDPRRREEEKIAQDTAAVAYVGGADTTVSAVQSFFLAMAMYPEVQKKAQAEIDQVIGSSRLPEFSDRPSLPYINALVKESMRWQLVTPLAVGHMCSKDDEYNGYFIPKGTIVIGNAWAILHDPTVFSNPLEYQPERYLKHGQLDPDARNPDVAAFGFGRRICAGRYMSDNSLYAFVSSVLAVYDIKPPIDDDGNPLQLKAEVTTGLLS
ncbi:hypothetical protein NLJ89_g4394 [Agrocybe chaxingu]|uniref:Cytochrome P450 n=1 Tax=Agrocybe chaxingu TaxID=84603 RepID=A0A9W8MUL3_9AGAR|nr:hypothetical protein NLJ89_g4394 [Agrocybe chaxingu]